MCILLPLWLHTRDDYDDDDDDDNDYDNDDDDVCNNDVNITDIDNKDSEDICHFMMHNLNKYFMP